MARLHIPRGTSRTVKDSFSSKGVPGFRFSASVHR